MDCVIEDVPLAARRASSSYKKSMFLSVVRPLLPSYTAFSLNEEGVITEISLQFLLTRLASPSSANSFIIRVN